MERTFQAPAQAVFDAWTSEEVMRRWWHAEHDWETTVAPRSTCAWAAPCAWSCATRTQASSTAAAGATPRSSRPTRLAFTWLWDDDTTRQLIELDFEEADGVTTVRFTHSGLWDEEAVRSHEGGWGNAFDNLARVVA